MLVSFIHKVCTHKVVRYLISGGTAAAVDLGLLFLLVRFAHLWYLAAAVLAFIGAFFVSFVMQKFLTFREHSRDRIPVQMSTYLLVALCNLAINTFLMYVSVDHIGAHYLIAQFVVNGLIAMYSFFIYKHLIFHSRPPKPSV